MSEFLVIMRKGVTAQQLNRVITAVQSRRGRVSQYYPPHVIIGQGSRDIPAMISHLDGVGAVHATPVNNPEALELDTAGTSAVRAWNLRLTDEYRSKKVRPTEGRPFNFLDRRKGGDIWPLETPDASSMSGAAPACRNTSMYMLGSVAVGVVLVEGPGTGVFTTGERDHVNAEIIGGTDILINLVPTDSNGIPRLKFFIDVQIVTLTAAHASEQAWRDDAMARLGYAPGYNGLYDYLHDLRTIKWPEICPGPDWAYVAFFTKYPSVRPAGYAERGGPRQVIWFDFFDSRSNPSNTLGYTIYQIDYLFAHETGHIFGAPDEYDGSSTCDSNISCSDRYGYLNVANGNCEVCSGQFGECLMWGFPGVDKVCVPTIGHFGWRDSDSNNLPDPIDPAGSYGTDVGITPGTPFYNNADLWIRNQDDGEANQSHQRPRSDLENYIYARIRNFGGVRAEIVRVQYYLADWTGTEFVFPNDYTNLLSAPNTPCPTTFCLYPGVPAVSKVHLRPAQIPPTSWHPCLLVHVTSAQDVPVPAGSHVWDSNNLAQKNFVIDYVAPLQMLILAVMLQNSSAAQPVFQIKRIAVPREASIQLQFQDGSLKPQIIKPNNAGDAFSKRWNRLFFQIPPVELAEFKLPIGPQTRKTAGVGFMTPGDARIGDEYRFELIQYNDQRPTGGITFVMHIVEPLVALKEQQWRCKVLRELHRQTGISRLSDLADAAEALIQSHLTPEPIDDKPTRTVFLKVLREIATPDAWGYEVRSLSEAIDTLESSSGLTADLNALSLLLFHAQERLLVDHQTR